MVKEALESRDLPGVSLSAPEHRCAQSRTGSARSATPGRPTTACFVRHAVDLVSPLGRDGQPRGSSARKTWAVLEQAARRKRETTYPELLTARRCRPVVFGIEVGGRWNGEARDLLRAPARAKARERPQWLRASALQAFHQRWSGVVAVAAQRALAATLAGLPSAGQDAFDDGAAPPLPEVLAAARHGAAEAVSRLPLRPG